MRKLGIIAGSGPVPLKLAEACVAMGRPVFVVGIEGEARPDIEAYDHGWSRLGAIGTALELLRKAECEDVCIIGPVRRPDFTKLKLDWTGTKLLPRVLNAARKGDDALLSFFVRWMEDQGFAVVGAEDVLSDLVAPSGPIGAVSPDDRALDDIDLGKQVVHALDDLDVGQGAVVCNGLVLAVEAAEGTDEMLKRTALLPENVRGTPQMRRGVLVKLPKPSQDRRVDLPMMGAQTVTLAAAAGLAGIAIEAGGAIVFDREEVTRLADTHGMFVFAFEKQGPADE
ncbi:UDP-2,3-diacylglucosamine diphosphatase LpxI [Pyruvatibacter sp.]|uniref:LpxI family protein n=1 Tax=Pyruvatibacter sp. TaxID=1981328 RepID=UPI0032EBEEB8